MRVDHPPGGVLAYIEAAQPLHAGLQKILTQSAGYALLVMMRPGRPVLLDGPVRIARDALAETHAGLDAMRVPEAARHHHHHMRLGAQAVGRALDLLLASLRPNADDATRADLSRMLGRATDHLRTATRLLPGFEMVDLSQACCALHARAAATPICQAVEG